MNDFTIPLIALAFVIGYVSSWIHLRVTVAKKVESILESLDSISHRVCKIKNRRSKYTIMHVGSIRYMNHLSLTSLNFAKIDTNIEYINSDLDSIDTLDKKKNK